MASNSRSPIRRLPTEIVADILKYSDSIRELGTSIFSHPIFYDAFKAFSHSIAQRIITTQIPEKILPYALLLLESDQMEPGDLVALRAFRYIAENDVAYVAWTNTYFIHDQDDLNLDELFTRGLSFHLKLYQAKTFEAISQLLKPPFDPDTRWGISDVFDCLTDPLDLLVREREIWHRQVQDLTDDELHLIQRPYDGEFDGLESSSCRNWKCAFDRHLLSNCRLDTGKSWLLKCAYVMWDYDGVSDSFLSGRLRVLFNTQPPHEIIRSDYRGDQEWDEIHQSLEQRMGIYARGGKGWWPAMGVDFSRVTGLTEQDKEDLISEWRSRGWVESNKRKRSGSSSSRSSVESTITVR
ncbi:hypothetical protein H9Q69_014021 [Fusarium xylarioides]|nr:hypothetical protein H9Q70_009624 [Fusarium xylarioides]KAG5776300.1 hypothetical protein H9Q73_010045 [Fusarium xylarioides]KAG5786903.1 hypothetical protein H9Q69_014021 [Fusarium xylarioides]